MRGRRLTIPAIGRAAAFVVVAAALIATAVHLAHSTRGVRPQSVDASPSADPLAGEMRRCQALAMAANDDAACEAAWAENRQRFFTYRPAASAAAPTAAPNPLKQ